MPLLNKKPLELHRYNKKLKDDAEVFYCKCTNEIFEDYEEYCQRVISCNSLIWTCAMTGKSNLTYQEALASEQNALKSIKDFPLELRTPVLFLASKSNRKNFNDLANDVFHFAKDRYFLGESVEACFDDVWVYGHVLQVILPTKQEVDLYRKQKGISGPVNSRPYPGSLYKYEVEQLEDDCESGISEVRVLSGDKVRRIKGVYTKEKNRVYLKQFAELKKDKWCIQSNILSKYSISSIIFSHMFVGEPPIFNDNSTDDSKFTQQNMENYLIKKTEKKQSKSLDVSRKSFHTKLSPENVKIIHKKYQDTINKVVEQAREGCIQEKMVEDKAKKVEEIKKKREQEREEKARLATFVKEWQRKRDDLECEDLKDLPVACPISCRIPNEFFGDIVMILEFFSCFREVLKVKDYFPFGLKFEIIERALVDVEIAGPFCDILQILLTSLFTLQEQEHDEIQSTDYHHSTDLELNESGDISTAEAIKLATIAARWSAIHHGVPLNKLSLDPITVSEVLRLHLLASGGRSGDRSAKWRYQERGGYRSTDDPGLMLRLKEPQILRFLAVKCAVELPIGDKLKVLLCLINQILSYAELRDIIDERYDKVKTTKLELKNDQLAESKKEKEIMAQRMKEMKEAEEKGEVISEEFKEQIEKEKKAFKKKKMLLHKRALELQKAAMDCHIRPLGQDRAYRRFWIFTTLGGLFVEDNEPWPGSCLSSPTPSNRGLVNLEGDTMSYVKKLFEEERNCGSDKENEGNSTHPVASPKKKLLSESNGMPNNLNSKAVSPVKEEETEQQVEEKMTNFVCSGNPDMCVVHSRKKNRVQWLFYHKESEIEELISCLNKRGHREHRLRKALIESRDNIIPKLGQCPVNVLNKFALNPRPGHTKFTRSQRGYENANLKYPTGTPIQEILELYIRELILDTEKKIYFGGLGSIEVKDRIAWRKAIGDRSYDKQDDNLTWWQQPLKKNIEKPKEEESNTSRPDTPCSIDGNPDHDVLAVKMDQNQVVKDLASAVLQIGRSVEQKYLQKPLFGDDKKKDKVSAMERWEYSLMSSTSFAQVYLHIATLENSIQWNKSILNARCQICRKRGDGENMLLCDSCNRGFHLYCLKPKLTNIPKGDWFCLGCRPKEKVERTKRSRRLFSEESDGGSGDDQSAEEDESQTVSTSKSRRSRTEIESTKKRKLRKTEDEDSSDEPLSKLARLCRKSDK